MKFIHLSDLHFHRNQSDNKEALDTLKFINKNLSNHNLIITGDIVDDGHEKQFKNAHEALEPFKDRIFICPGNHDFGALGNFYSKERAEKFDYFLSSPLEQGGTFTGDQTPVVNIQKENSQLVMLIALDSNLETETPFDFACGEISETQLNHLDTILIDPSNATIPKILFFHHHPFMHNHPFMELKDGRGLMRTIYQKVNILLFGHKHEMGKWNNINGIQHVRASDNSPGKKVAREITIVKNKITIKDIKICN